METTSDMFIAIKLAGEFLKLDLKPEHGGEDACRSSIISWNYSAKKNVTQIDRMCRSCWKSSSALENFVKKGIQSTHTKHFMVIAWFYIQCTNF